MDEGMLCHQAQPRSAGTSTRRTAVCAGALSLALALRHRRQTPEILASPKERRQPLSRGWQRSKPPSPVPEPARDLRGDCRAQRTLPGCLFLRKKDGQGV
jgi:hypothetical protein